MAVHDPESGVQEEMAGLKAGRKKRIIDMDMENYGFTYEGRSDDELLEGEYEDEGDDNIQEIEEGEDDPNQYVVLEVIPIGEEHEEHVMEV